jgi:hypothetical protein
VGVCMCDFVMCEYFDNCAGVLVICVFLFTVLCIVGSVFYCFVYVNLFLFFWSVVV